MTYATHTKACRRNTVISVLHGFVGFRSFYVRLVEGELGIVFFKDAWVFKGRKERNELL